MKLFPILTSLFLAAACSVQAQKPLGDELGYKGFNTLKSAIVSAGLESALSGTEALTILAPTDNAFRDLPKTQLDALLADKEQLKKVLMNHVLDGKVSIADLKAAKLKTKGGLEVQATTADGKIKINSATVVKPDVAAANGMIQGIDKILLP